MANNDARSNRGRNGFVAAAGLLCLLFCGCPGASTSGNYAKDSDPLEVMKTAYQRASTYADAGELHIEVTEQGKVQEPPEIPFSVTLERPNKLRVDAWRGTVRCDGKGFWAVVEDPGLTDQVLYHESPADLTLQQVYSDSVLDQMLSNGIELRLPQLELLLADRPLESVFGEDYRAKRLEDKTLDDEERPYQRIEVKSKRGKFVAWIDPKSHVLRRLEMPADIFHERFDPEHRAQFRVWADFSGAKFGSQINADAFKFEAPQSAKLMKRFVPPPPGLRDAPHELLGKRPGKFTFVDLQGKPVDFESLRGKVAVLDIWSISCEWCFRGFPNLEKVYKQFKDDDRVAIITVNNDDPRLADKTVQEAFDKAGVHLPIARDREQETQNVLKVVALPTMFILGPDGTVQDYELGYKEDLAEVLPKKIERLLAGESLADVQLAKYQLELQDYEKRVAAELAGATQEIELPRATIGERSDPTSFKLNKLWTAANIKHPGNMLVVAGDAGPRIIVLDGWSKVVELDGAGKVTGQTELKLLPESTVTQLRTAVDGQGHRYFAAFTSMQQQVYVFDNDWKQLFSYPEGKHAGLADVQLADLDGDGQLELNVSYWGAVGIQNVSLEGKRLWSYRDQDNVLSLAALDPDAENHRPLLFANERQAIGMLDYAGKPLPDIPVEKRDVDIVIAADLDGQPPLDLAVLASSKSADLSAVGIDREGHELWSYPLPRGARNTPCDVLIAGRVRPTGPGQWLLSGPDGSIHVLAADGSPLDKFNYGTEMTGIATAEVDGRPVLLVSSARELVAWSIESSDSVQEARPKPELSGVDSESTGSSLDAPE